MIGVVVVSHHAEAELPSCLDHLWAARGVEQVVVVDNASTDRSRELARRHGDRRLLLLEEAVNHGFAGGCNRGLAALHPELEWVAFMNPDVELAADTLTRAVDAGRSAADVAAVAPRLMRRDGVTVDSVGQLLSPWSLEVRDRGYGRPMEPHLAGRREVLAACGALAVFRRDALAAVADAHGPWAEHFFCFWEDLELGWRLNNHGWRVLAAADAVAVHGRGAGAGQGRGRLRWRRPVELEACILSNRWMTLLRHLHSRDLAARLPILLAWDLAMVTLGVGRRPRLAAALRRRLPLVRQSWAGRRAGTRRRLAELPW